MSRDGPRRSASRRRGTARHRAAAVRAESSGLTLASPIVSLVAATTGSAMHPPCHKKTPVAAGPFRITPPKRRLAPNSTLEEYLFGHEWIVKRHDPPRPAGPAAQPGPRLLLYPGGRNWPRGDGRGIPGPGRAAETRRRGQGPAARPRVPRGNPRAFPARSGNGRAPVPSAHRADSLRRRGTRWPRLFRDGLRGW